MPARLTAYLPEGAAAEYLLRDPGTTRIGRAPPCEFLIEHPSVSRLHAELRHQDGHWQLRDLDSKNGSFVEGARVSLKALPVATWLRFGDVTCEFQPLDAAALARAENRGAARRTASAIHIRDAERQRELPDLLKACLAAVVDISGAERGFLLLAGPDGLGVRAWQGLDRATLAAPDFLGSVGAVERALREQAPVVLHDVGSDHLLGQRASVVAGGLRALVCLPLMLDGQVLGVAYADSRRPGSAITGLELELLAAFCERAALWIAARRSESELAEASARFDWADIAAAHAGDARGRH